jgi:transposase InsO family protein
MPWEETTRMEQRARLVEEFESTLYSVTELCRRYGISRKTAYKWLNRYGQEGTEGLQERSRVPKTSPSRTSREVVDPLLALRRAHPSWGPRKLLVYLNKKHPETSWPAASTVGDILKSHGLVQPRRLRSSTAPQPGPLTQPVAPNDVWACDFKGQFRTADGQLCYPLTVTDSFSRYLLGVDGLDSVAEQRSWPVFVRLFRTYGLPQVIRSDNGSPFASSRSLAGLSHLSVRWIKLGIVPQRIKPGHPEQNGSHERMHRDLKQETVRPPAANQAAQQKRFDQFQQVRNQERPHEALGQKTPAEVYCCSPRPYPEKLTEPCYPGHFEVRSVRHTGEIKFHGRRLFLSEALRQQRVGLEEFDDGRWSVYFAQVLLGRFDERDFQVYG